MVKPSWNRGKRMVVRSGFYIEDNKVKRLDVQIPWDQGWSKVAKIQYIQLLHAELQKYLPGKIIEDVTSASSPWARELSPLYVRKPDGQILEDYIQELIHSNNPNIEFDGFIWPGYAQQLAFMHLYCIYAKYLIARIRIIDVFTDVFYNPTNTGAGTQALACALMKLMDLQGKSGVVNNVVDFVTWYGENIDIER